MQPSSGVFSVGQVVALVVAVVTTLRAAWLLAMLLVVTDEKDMDFVWPFSLHAFYGDTGISQSRHDWKTGWQQLRGNRWQKTTENSEREVVCGPLLNYRRIEGAHWFGSVLVLIRGGEKSRDCTPTLRLGQARAVTVASTNESNTKQSFGSPSAIECLVVVDRPKQKRKAPNRSCRGHALIRSATCPMHCIMRGQ